MFKRKNELVIKTNEIPVDILKQHLLLFPYNMPKYFKDIPSTFMDDMRRRIRSKKMIVPSALQFTAERLLKSPGRVGTADNDINAVKNMGMIPQGYVVNHYLTDTDAWFIKTDVPNGLKHFVRAPVKTAMEGDFETGNVRYKARERYSFGWSDWRGIFGSPGA